MNGIGFALSRQRYRGRLHCVDSRCTHPRASRKRESNGCMCRQHESRTLFQRTDGAEPPRSSREFGWQLSTHLPTSEFFTHQRMQDHWIICDPFVRSIGERKPRFRHAQQSLSIGRTRGALRQLHRVGGVFPVVCCSRRWHGCRHWFTSRSVIERAFKASYAGSTARANKGFRLSGARRRSFYACG
jgi:hypothetical protein